MEGLGSVSESGAAALDGSSQEQSVQTAQVDNSTPVSTNEDVAFSFKNDLDTQQEVQSSSNDTIEGWNWSKDIPGSGDKPEWFKTGTFKSVEDQAKGYTEMKSAYDKRYGAFTGAPEGDYEVKLSEDLTESGYNLSTDSDAYKAFSAFARENNMSQESFQGALNVFAQYESSMINAQNESISTTIQQSVDAELAKINPESAKEFNQCVRMAANIDGVTEEGLNDILEGITSAKGVENFNRIVKSTLVQSVPSQVDTFEITKDSLLADMAKYKSMNDGPEKDLFKKRLDNYYNKYYS